MRIGYLSNGISCELEMQSKLKEWLTAKELKFIDELYVSEVSRRPDFLVWKPGNGLINIEAKCNNHEEIIKQLRDNANYCDYSFAYIPDYSNTTKSFKRSLLEYGFGLIIYHHNMQVITEVLESHQNKGIDRALRNMVIQRMDKEIIRRKKAQIIDTQQTLKL